MESYLGALSPKAWEVTANALHRAPNDSQIKWNAQAKNALFEAISEEIFARVHSKATAHDIWDELEKIHVGSKRLREDKYQVLKDKLDEFKMLPNELVDQMYSRLNVLVEDINALEISPLSNSDIIRKMHINTLEVADVVRKIRSHEMFFMGEIEPPLAKKDLALKAKSDHKSKKKNKCKAPPSSSHEEDHKNDVKVVQERVQL
jgi:hypothetical protein